MKKIFLLGKLGLGKFALVDNEDYEKVNQYKWHLNTWGYPIVHEHIKGSGRINAKQRTIWMHRVIMNAPDNMQVDHVNNNTLDNRKLNLRICTRQQNQFNLSRPKNNTSGYKGVYWLKINKRWMASISINDKQKHLGCFSTKEEAAIEYNKAAKKHRGEYANLNML